MTLMIYKSNSFYPSALNICFAQKSREKISAIGNLNHLKYNKGYRHDLMEAFPELDPMDVSNLLQELKRDGKIRFIGHSKTGYWEPVN